MKRVTGIGGVFFKADDPQRLYSWYEQHLGIKCEPDGSGAVFQWRDDSGGQGMTIWSAFPRTTKYFKQSRADFMINFRVANLEELMGALREEGIEVEGPEDHEYGRFAWITDPEGNRIELWEPPKP